MLKNREQTGSLRNLRRERAVADKPVFVDLISEATRQVRRRIVRQVVKPEAKHEFAARSPVQRDDAVAGADLHAMEAQALELERLGVIAHAICRVGRGARAPCPPF